MLWPLIDFGRKTKLIRALATSLRQTILKKWVKWTKLPTTTIYRYKIFWLIVIEFAHENTYIGFFFTRS